MTGSVSQSGNANRKC